MNGPILACGAPHNTAALDTEDEAMFLKARRGGSFPFGDQVMERHRFEDLADLVGEAVPEHMNEKVIDSLTSTRFLFAADGLSFRC
jgi:hypothetical protein